jgi:hypothetical protein
MTVKEALQGALDGLSFSDIALEKALLDQELIPADTYASANGKRIDLAAVELLLMACTQPDVQEGGYGLSHPDFLRKVQARLLYLARKHNLQPLLEQFRPKVTGKSPW